MDMKNYRTYTNKTAFSIIELIIGLTVIALITSAFAPVFTKKLKTNAMSLGSLAAALSKDCEEIEENCRLCNLNTKKCIIGGAPPVCLNNEYIDNRTCVLCTPGYYCNGKNRTACAEGHYSTGGAASCTECPSGHYITEFAVSCTECPSGYYSQAGATSCTKCPSGHYSEGGAASCTECPQGNYANSSHTSCTPCSDTYSNCETCNSNACTKCASGYILSDGECVTFPCQGDYIMQLPNPVKANHNICVTKYNMGDQSVLPIANTVTTVNVNTNCSPSSTKKCCWKGTTANGCDSSNGSYSGCSRTVCDWRAANDTCTYLNYNNLSWRLPEYQEMANWNHYSISLGSNGLRLCDDYAGFGSARCYHSGNCTGAAASKHYSHSCLPGNIWSATHSGSNAAYNAYIYQGGWYTTGTKTFNAADSVRCVADVGCAGDLNCETCNGETCTACKSGYYLSDFGTCLKQRPVAQCASGYIFSDGECIASPCQGDYLMQIPNPAKANHNICVTKYNMGDQTVLPIANTVTTVNVNTSCIPSETKKCCWKGTTANGCDSSNGSYSGCSRTVCDWRAANDTCTYLNYNNLSWRLPEYQEMANWNHYSISLGSNGLRLCDDYAGFGSARCYHSGNCTGAAASKHYSHSCLPGNIWSATHSGSNAAYNAYIWQGAWCNTEAKTFNAADSVRCVADMGCAGDLNCETCNGETCTACKSGYYLSDFGTCLKQ